ncbi:MAG: radical SAM protein [Candidatus Woesearchaeota archaeon]
MDIYKRVKSLVSQNYPLGIGYIASFLRQAGHEIIFIDPEIMDMTYDDIANKIKETRPGLVCITSMTSNLHSAVKLAQIAKENTNIITVLGGIHASSLPYETMKQYKEFDVLVIREGELTMKELCSAVEKGENFNGVKGIMFREGDKIIKTEPRPLIDDIDSLPFPARDLVDLGKYEPPEYLKINKKSATVRTSRGCPNQCTFCAAHLSMGYKFRPNSPDYVIREIRHLKEKYGVEYIIFYDDTFTINRQRVVDICNRLIDEKLNIEFFCLARVNTIDEDLVRLMKKAGLRAFSFGVESGNQQILNNIKKGTTLEQVRKAFKIVRKVGGIRIFSSFMMGLPGETHETIKDTINFAIDLNPDKAFFFILTPFPGSEIYNEYNGKLFNVSGDWKDYKYVLTDGTLALDSNVFTKDELKNYLVMANKKFYTRPSYILGQIFKIRTYDEFLAHVKGASALFKQMMIVKKDNRQ